MAEETVLTQESEEKDTNSTPTIEELNATIKKLTDMLDKQKLATTNASKDASEWKRQFRETQSEAEREKADRDEELSKLRETVATYQRNATISDLKAQYIAMGYDDALASKRAEFMADGNVIEATKCESEFIAKHDKEIKADGFRTMPRPNGSSDALQNGVITKEQFDKMGYRELVELHDKDPELYERLKNQK